MEIDSNTVAHAFNEWAQQAELVQAGNNCAIDGKGLKNTLTDPFRAQQNFVNIVSDAKPPNDSNGVGFSLTR